MTTVTPCHLPAEALLARYCREGHYTDCYVAETDDPVAQSDYVTAFYTTWLFKLERLILRLALNIATRDEDVAALAAGTRRDFSAWTVEDRNANELLLADFRGRTRSWLMSEPVEKHPNVVTRLYFGSAVIPLRTGTSGPRRLGRTFHGLLWFHRLYSRALLGAAVARLRRRR